MCSARSLYCFEKVCMPLSFTRYLSSSDHSNLFLFSSLFYVSVRSAYTHTALAVRRTAQSIIRCMRVRTLHCHANTKCLECDDVSYVSSVKCVMVVSMDSHDFPPIHASIISLFHQHCRACTVWTFNSAYYITYLCISGMTHIGSIWMGSSLLMIQTKFWRKNAKTITNATWRRMTQRLCSRAEFFHFFGNVPILIHSNWKPKNQIELHFHLSK